MNGLCKDCRWWDEVDIGNAYGFCDLGGSEDGLRAEHPETRAYAVVNTHEEQGFRQTFLRTRYDFGCDQFEPVEATDE